MEKKITLVFFLFNIYLSLWCQNSIKTDAPCTDAMAQNARGKWINSSENVGTVSSSQKQEAYNRLDILHNILLKMYPQPTGVDVRVSRGAGIGYFGSTRKYSSTGNYDFTFDYLKVLPNKSYSYFANFSPHYCAHTNKGIVFMPGSKNENSDGISITVNDFGGLVNDLGKDDDWTINGLPVRLFSLMPWEKWKGYDVYGSLSGRVSQILIHREGILPFIPVTRKQYLDRCLFYTSRLNDKMIASMKLMPVRSPEVQEVEKKAKLDKFEKQFGNDPKKLKANIDYYLSGYQTDQQRRDEQVAKAIKHKEDELKKFTDEMEKTTNEGLLDSPAVIQAIYSSPPAVFETDPQKGSMLVIENPDYIRNELPVYIPQFMVLQWKWTVDYYPCQKKHKELLLQDFPIEKLQAMIDE